jgi:radical SAM superfamily enzyme YgiQ (UPF0313 family)
MIARVFARRTNATPADDYAFVGDPPLSCFIPDDIEEVHVSVAFTWDLPEAERLARAWSRIAPVKIGGPATGMRGEDFTPGMYLKPGYTITSRGCPNVCWFCSVPQREGREIREYTVNDGNVVLDDNLLACSESHIREVFCMLKRQKYGRPLLLGGLEAARLKLWHVELIKEIRPKRVFFAYDTPDDLIWLRAATKMFMKANYCSCNILHAYVLIGYPGDTFEAAEMRLRITKALCFTPMAMLYRDVTGKTTEAWRRFQRAWARPAAIYAKRRDMSYLNGRSA